MIGVGIDIVEVSRINKIIKRDDGAFLRKVFTKKEILNSVMFPSRAEYFSLLFAFKESFAKAKGSGFTKSLRPNEIGLDILKNPVSFPGDMKVYFKNKKIRNMRLIEFSKIENNIICCIILDN